MDKLVFYIALLIITITVAKVFKEYADYVQIGDELENVSCGEALNRANGSAAPRNEKEVKQLNDCLFLGIKQWR